MTMPTNSKTWVFDVNNEVNTGVTADDMKIVLLALKDFFVTAGATVVRSCNSVAVSNGDEWVDVGDLVWGTTGARSWAVLRMPANFGDHLDILIECRWASSTYTCALVVYMSAEGYNLATGNTTTLPTVTAGTQVTLQAYSSADVANLIPRSTVKKIWNGAYSNDNECIRFWVFCAGKCCTYLEVARLKNPAPELAAIDSDFICTWHHAQVTTTVADVTTYGEMYVAAASSFSKGYILGSAGILFELSGECRGGSTTPATYQFTAVGNPQDGDAWPMLPIGVWTFSDNTYAYGRHGEVYDLWWAPANLITGSTFPGDGSKTHIQLGNAFVIPWDAGVVPVIT